MTEHGAGFLAEFQFLGGSHANCALEQTEDGEEDERDAPTRWPWWMGSQGSREGHGGRFWFMGRGEKEKVRSERAGRRSVGQSVGGAAGEEEDATVAVMRG